MCKGPAWEGGPKAKPGHFPRVAVSASGFWGGHRSALGSSESSLPLGKVAIPGKAQGHDLMHF